ncbi:Crp/Fnr family transcriptional regulator [Spirosoma arcticum]
MKHDKLLTLMRSLVTVTEADRVLLEAFFKPIAVVQHTRLVEPGQVARQLYFINQGYVRVFSTEDNGNEVTSHLNCQPGFITAFDSFIHQSPSTTCVECLTDCQLLAISRPNLDQLYLQSQHVAEFSRLIFEQSVSYNEQRAKDLVTLTAEQRYLKLLHHQPDIVQNVPLQYIASFIGIKPESLSRIRRQIIS